MDESASELRKRLQAHRKSLSLADRSRIQSLLDNQFMRFLSEVMRVQPGQVMGMHRPLPWEWTLTRSIELLRAAGVSLAYPRMHNPSDRMAGLAWHLADEGQSSNWRPCRRMKALLEPQESLPEIDPAGLAGVWVPGVAFSEHGERLGTGGGFYDVFLSQFSCLKRVAVAADFQLFPKLPGQRPDEPRMSHIVCETRILSFRDDE